MEIERLVAEQKAYFLTGATRPVHSRLKALTALKAAILSHEEEILQALRADLGKSEQESYMSEVGMVLSELNHILRRLPGWARREKVKTPMSAFPATSYIYKEPYGTVLVMSPWNYPFLLTMDPVIGAICAGNTVVIKPSNDSPATSAVIRKMISEVLPPELAVVVTGGRAENTALLGQKFDYIFFTGSTAVGRVVMEAAAANLTPVSLELGGKSPCIVDETADIALAARRIAFGKYLNAGQTCVAPDYLYIHISKKEQFIALFQENIRSFFGHAPLKSHELPHIVNRKHYERLMRLLEGTHILAGGEGDGQKISPTLVDQVTWDSPIMQEEIFGPILPILTFDRLEDALGEIARRPHPLALYLFTTDKASERRVLEGVSYGGGCVNDTIVHLATPHMPFGGVGASGLGGYHGKYSFDTFTHKKSVLKKGSLDLNMRYHPYSDQKERMIRRVLK